MIVHSFFRNTFVLTVVMVGLFLFQSVPIASAQTLSTDITAQYEAANNKAGLAKEKPQQYIASFIKVILSITGMLFLVLLFYAGYTRMTAHGDEDRLKISTKTAVAALIGLAIVMLSYGITRFVLPRVYNAATYEPQYEENNQSPDVIYEKSIDINLF